MITQLPFNLSLYAVYALCFSELMLSADVQEMLLIVTKMLTCLFFDWYGSHTRRPDGVHLD